MIFVVDDDKIMAECIARACANDCQIFTNAIAAINALSDALPDLIFLDILLDGPDGFTFLHELASYADTAKIPIVLVTSLDLAEIDLKDYGVVGILSKDTFSPQEIKRYVAKYAR